MCSGTVQFVWVVSLLVYIHIVGTDSVSGGLKSGMRGPQQRLGGYSVACCCVYTSQCVSDLFVGRIQWHRSAAQADGFNYFYLNLNRDRGVWKKGQ